MAIVPTLGTGVFIGTGQALAAGGPASLLGSYLFMSLLVYCLTTAFGEIATHVPFQNGTLITHTYRYTSSHLGFSLSLLRWYTLGMLVPFEITTAMVNLGLWQPGANSAIRISIMTIVIFGFNMLPDRIFRRSETAFTILKFLTTGLLVIVSSYLAIRGIPGTPIRGFHYWRQPGPIKEHIFSGDLGRFFGLLQCLLYSTISFVFLPELTVHRAEQLDSEPGPSVFKRARLYNLLLIVLYVLSAFSTTLMSPYDDPLLTNHGTGAGFSPFVVGIKKAKIPALPVIATSLIFLSSVASGRSFLYTSSRVLCTLAENGHAPQVFRVRNRWDVPYVSIVTSAIFSILAYLCLVTSSSAMFNFLMFFITTSGCISWACSCIVYLRFRRTTQRVGVFPTHQSYLQPFGTYFSLVCSVLLPVANVLQIVVGSRPQFNANTAITAIIGVVLFISMYIGHRIRYPESLQNTNSENSQATHHDNMTENQTPQLQKEGQPTPRSDDGSSSGTIGATADFS